LLLAKTSSELVKRQVSAHLTTYQHVKPTLTGDDLKALGLKPGPTYKKVLTQLLDARLNGDVKSTRDEWEFVRKIANL
jgi:tRNA nucleotidyltransferase (CCA-adding enzyme)